MDDEPFGGHPVVLCPHIPPGMIVAVPAGTVCLLCLEDVVAEAEAMLGE